MALILETKAGEEVLSPDCLLVFIDETGHELFADPHYPVFGLGGCVVEGRLFDTEMDEPWQRMKDSFFDGRDRCLHAASLRRPSKRQLRALTRYFRRGNFGRIAATTSENTDFTTAHSNHKVVALSLMKSRLVEVARWMRFDSVAVIVEDSRRTNSLVAAHISIFDQVILGEGDKRETIPIRHYFAPKGVVSGLEVADFIMHAAGGQTRARLRGRTAFQKDYSAVFRGVKERLVGTMDITKVRDK
jgi:hypothetical protein